VPILATALVACLTDTYLSCLRGRAQGTSPFWPGEAHPNGLD
jgi:hypothetical protein